MLNINYQARSMPQAFRMALMASQTRRGVSGVICHVIEEIYCNARVWLEPRFSSE